MKLKKDTYIWLAIIALAVVLFTRKTETMALMAIEFSDVSGWWTGLSSSSQLIGWIVVGIIFFIIVVSIMFKKE